MGVCTLVLMCSLAYPACNAYTPCCDVICGLCRHHIIRHYHINGTVFGKVTDYKMCSDFSLQLLSRTFQILKRIWRNIVINVKTYSCKVPVILVGF